MYFAFIEASHLVRVRSRDASDIVSRHWELILDLLSQQFGSTSRLVTRRVMRSIGFAFYCFSQLDCDWHCR